LDWLVLQCNALGRSAFIP
jgi:hypothetical protein